MDSFATLQGLGSLQYTSKILAPSYIHLVEPLHLLSRPGLAVAADDLGAVLVLQVALVPLLRLEEHLAVRAPEQRRVVNLRNMNLWNQSELIAE